MVNFSWVNDQIAVSGAILDEDVYALRKEGIHAIIEVRSEACDNAELMGRVGLQFLHVAVRDCESPTREQLDEIFRFVDPLLEKGKKVLIHCQNGCGRSPLTVIAILIKRGMNVPDAVRVLEEKHPRTGFTDQQERFLYDELAKIVGER